MDSRNSSPDILEVLGPYPSTNCARKSIKTEVTDSVTMGNILPSGDAFNERKRKREDEELGDSTQGSDVKGEQSGLQVESRLEEGEIEEDESLNDNDVKGRGLEDGEVEERNTTKRSRFSSEIIESTPNLDEHLGRDGESFNSEGITGNEDDLSHQLGFRIISSRANHLYREPSVEETIPEESHADTGTPPADTHKEIRKATTPLFLSDSEDDQSDIDKLSARARKSSSPPIALPVSQTRNVKGPRKPVYVTRRAPGPLSQTQPQARRSRLVFGSRIPQGDAARTEGDRNDLDYRPRQGTIEIPKSHRRSRATDGKRQLRKAINARKDDKNSGLDEVEVVYDSRDPAKYPVQPPLSKKASMKQSLDEGRRQQGSRHKSKEVKRTNERKGPVKLNEEFVANEVESTPDDPIGSLLVPCPTIWSFHEYIMQDDEVVDDPSNTAKVTNRPVNSGEPIQLYTLDIEDDSGTPQRDYALLPEDDPEMRTHVLEKLIQHERMQYAKTYLEAEERVRTLVSMNQYLTGRVKEEAQRTRRG
ncbi:hypothetical protein BKA70DRAFT_1562049 [Coprinopsis sp. MPI-PUGE-AT-0042]|nr:hypothetical protein BKA70DRAFT_1562049 [Coprinopsis sp. MPI-PUGE-AT-0042]